ncbi:caspase family protein [Dongia sedimenti]|uniref:Caspase family protein n=1 Tax=Dongia sedimenti TaxID=3064282 RepID=A0ABU0YQ58_9PROT|nr:caspase family protein [Rhodospirillaceae bacterium R-7]
MTTVTRFTALALAGLLLLAGADQAIARPDAPPPFVRHEPRIALVIGNANYADEMKLANPANDAALIGGTLEQVGFEVILVTDATQKQMQRAIVDFGDRLAKAGPDAVGLFYYAGHGLQLGGQNYLVPTDADISREVDVEIDGVSADLVLKQMAYADSRVNIVILDACRNNPLARDFRSIAASQGFAEIRSKPKGTFISYSTAPGEVAVDGTDGHSPFAEALATAMQLPGLDLPEVFQRVRERVLAATGERQTPWDSSSLVKSFYFIPATQEPAKDALVADAAPAAAPTADSALRQTEAEAPEAKDTEATKAEPVFVAMTRSLYAKSGSRLRAEPSTDASVVAKLPANAEIRAVARSKDGAWYEVATKQGKTAYIHADAVTGFRAAKAKKAAAPSQAAAFAPQPVAPAPVARSKTGIGMVDQALNWLQVNSGKGGPAPDTVRASR